MAAKALVQMGQCYEKLGKGEAQKAYEQVVRDYADQAEPLMLARARLASLGSVGKERHLAKADGENASLIFRRIEFAGQGRTHLVRLSPDSTKMLYVDRKEKEPRDSLYVMELPFGQEKRLVEGVEAGSVLFFEWSPDGKRIVYKYGRGELRIIGSDGREPMTLWSSGDQRLAVYPVDWSRDSHNILCAVINRADGTGQLAILSSSGGEPRFVMKEGLKEFGEQFHFSPDGRCIVGQKTKEGNTDIYIWTVDGSQEIRLTEHPAKDDYPFWSPDGKYIVFSSDRAETKDLWAIPMQEAKPVGAPLRIKRNLGRNTRLTDYTASGVLTMLVFGEGTADDLLQIPIDSLTGEAKGQFLPFARYPTDHFMPRWSPDGRYIAYTSRKGDISLPRIFISSGSEKEDEEISIQNYYVGNVEWLRDGRYLIFPGWEPDRRVGIFRISLNDFGIDPLLLVERPGPGYEGLFINLQWLPIANAFMFEKFVDKSRREIYTMDKDGKNLQLVTDKIQTAAWTWPSPDGKYLAYLDAKDLKLWSLDVNAFLVTLALSLDGKPVEGPAWSPDGHRVAYSNKRHLKVFSLPESASRTLAEAKENSEIAGVPWAGGLAWSPNGQTIAYLSRDISSGSKAHSGLWIVPARGGTPRMIADAPASYPMLGELTWHPSGKVIFARGKVEKAPARMYEHWAMENFLPAAKVGK